MPEMQSASEDEEDEFDIHDDNYNSVIMTNMISSLGGVLGGVVAEEIN